jgi:hypothetical protein
VNFDLVRQDMEIAEHLHQTLGDFNQRKGADRFNAGIVGLYEDYTDAAVCNKSLLLLPILLSNSNSRLYHALRGNFIMSVFF